MNTNTNRSTDTNTHTFHAYEVAKQLIRELRPLLPVIRREDKNLASQLQRAATSVALNLAEGNRRLGRDRVHAFSIAAGSADEVRAALEVAEAWGYLPGPRTRPALGMVDRQLALLWRLTHPPRG